MTRPLNPSSDSVFYEIFFLYTKATGFCFVGFHVRFAQNQSHFGWKYRPPQVITLRNDRRTGSSSKDFLSSLREELAQHHHLSSPET